MCKVKTPTECNTLKEVIETFKDEETCLNAVEKWIWKNNVCCPYCGYAKPYKCKNHKFKCRDCEAYFSLRVGTIFEDSKLPLTKWFMAIFLIVNNKKGISSRQLAAHIGVTQRTAWFLSHRIRKAIEQDFEEKQLEGVVMIDESYVGGKNRNRHLDKKAKYNHRGGRSFEDKTPIVGLIQDNGYVRCGVIPKTDQSTLVTVVMEQVKQGSIIVTDDHNAYFQLKNFYNHQVVQHGKLQYKNDCGFSTNRIEGFWTTVKRTIYGCYHNVSRRLLHKYIDEIVFRHNTRGMGQWDRFASIMRKIKCRLTYKQLVYGEVI